MKKIAFLVKKYHLFIQKVKFAKMDDYGVETEEVPIGQANLQKVEKKEEKPQNPSAPIKETTKLI